MPDVINFTNPGGFYWLYKCIHFHPPPSTPPLPHTLHHNHYHTRLPCRDSFSLRVVSYLPCCDGFSLYVVSYLPCRDGFSLCVVSYLSRRPGQQVTDPVDFCCCVSRRVFQLPSESSFSIDKIQ